MTMTIGGTSGLVFPDASTQSTAATGFGFKNRIINGAMQVWQRGNTGTSGYSSVDRWVGISTTSMNRSTDVPSGFQYSLEFGNASATYTMVDQRIEAANSIDLVGQQLTVSFWAKNVSGASRLGAELFYANAADNFSGTTVFSSKVWLSPSSSWTQYTFTFSTVPANGANGLALRIYRNVDTASTTRITGVQLEKGSTATSFDYRPYGTELALCQRYYDKSYDDGVVPGTASNNGAIQSQGASGTLLCFAKFNQKMRSAPTVVSYAPDSGAAGNVWANGSNAASNIQQIGCNGVVNGMASGSSTWMRFHYTASAEL